MTLTLYVLLLIQDNQIILLCFAAHILQILIGFQPLPEAEQEQLPELPYCDVQAVERLWKQVNTIILFHEIYQIENLLITVRTSNLLYRAST